MRSQFLLKVSKDRWGRGRGVPTWVTLLCKSHYVDPVQIVFLWEKRIEGYTPGWRCEGVRDGLRAWNGNGRRGAAGGGRQTQRHREEPPTRTGRKSWRLINGFARQENVNCRKMLALNGPRSRGPGVRESSGGRQRRERARPAHRELCGHHALARHSSGNAMSMSA